MIHLYLILSFLSVLHLYYLMLIKITGYIYIYIYRHNKIINNLDETFFDQLNQQQCLGFFKCPLGDTNIS